MSGSRPRDSVYQGEGREPAESLKFVQPGCRAGVHERQVIECRATLVAEIESASQRQNECRVAGSPPTFQIGGLCIMKNDASRRKHLELALRLREMREELYGEYGSQFLADALGVRVETWLNYESGVSMPADVVLKLIDVARVSPHWLLTGEGDPHDYRSVDRIQ
jgi:hypothetical protein